MKKFLILFFATITFVSCDCWYDDPLILGYSEIKQNEEGRYICDIGNTTYQVDSVLTIKEGIKCYEPATLGKDVTIFTFETEDNIVFYFYKGHVSSEEIEKTYFQDDHSGEAKTIIFGLISLIAIVCFLVCKIL